LILAQKLTARIRQSGKITFYEWMNTALYHPTLGYYNREDLQRWGREGDYRTSPERSELFSATFARYFATLYDKLDQPKNFSIVEMGAGNGEFAAGVLQELQDQFPAVFDATKYIIHEKSEDARRRGMQRLSEWESKVEFKDLAQHEAIEAGLVFSNELLDAFPVHRLTMAEGKLQELFVDLDADGEFTWEEGPLSSETLNDFCRNHLPPLNDEQTVDINLDVQDWFQLLDKKLKRGYIVTVDYGSESTELYETPERSGGTLRGFRRHNFVGNVLEAPGETDLTTSVDWTYVKSEGKRSGFEADELSPLDKFLLQVGILDELEKRLTASTSEADKSRLTTAAREMILPSGMASSFQVLVQKRL